jgi:hypothetical protein
MEIIIKYKDEKKKMITKDFQSIHSIINNFLENSDITNKKTEDYYLDYNGKYLNVHFSLEKYEIKENYILVLNEKVKGGNNFFSYLVSHPFVCILSLIISMMPIFILPLGFIPTLASFIKTITDMGTSTISKYLVCSLGKTTLVSRLRILIFVLKYSIYFLMIYIIITLPLTILCVTLKGYSITDSPSNMCSALSAGGLTGMILTIIYAGIYLMLRGADYLFKPLISICKKFYILNTLFTPILNYILKTYDKYKYYPIEYIPYIGVAFKGYFEGLDAIVPGVKIVLSSIVNIGCKKLSIAGLMKDFKKTMGGTKDTEYDSDSDSIKKPKKTLEDKEYDKYCKEKLEECCSPSKFVFIADILMKIIDNDLVIDGLKSKGIFPTFILLIQSLYEKALTSYDTIRDTSKFTENMNDINQKLEILDEEMVEYAKMSDTVYTKGPSLFKIVLKVILINTFCNVLTTAKGSQDVIHEMGDLKEIVDTLKSGTVSGFFTSIFYFISVIILILCGIFNAF